MKRAMTALLALLVLSSGCAQLQGYTSKYSPKQGLSIGEIANGLKEALRVGTEKAVGVLHNQDGFLADATVKILFPPSVQKIANKLNQIGMGSLVTKFVVAMNRGAEKAVKRAIPIFVDVIKGMTFDDAKRILESNNDHEATQYFQRKTSEALYKAFAPDVKSALDQVGATDLWRTVTGTYNRIPFVSKVDTDIVRYVTNRALEGLFKKLAIQEQKIRKHPAARVTQLLAKVFGSIKR